MVNGSQSLGGVDPAFGGQGEVVADGSAEAARCVIVQTVGLVEVDILKVLLQQDIRRME
jgi:hypothetical protein